MSERAELDQIYTRYSKSVYRRARQLLGDVEAARDAMQEVFVRVLRSGGVVPAEPTPTAWLYRVTTNLCLNRLRDRSRQEALLATKLAVDPVVTGPGEARSAVSQILKRVPEDLHDIAVYFFVDELTYDEIAALLGVSRRTVSNRLSTFREIVAGLSADERSAS